MVRTSTREEIAHVAMYTPEPANVVQGRRFLYDARLSSRNGEAACGSCHVFGDLDSLAWDLGNPDAAVRSNPNPLGPLSFRRHRCEAAYSRFIRSSPGRIRPHRTAHDPADFVPAAY